MQLNAFVQQHPGQLDIESEMPMLCNDAVGRILAPMIILIIQSLKEMVITLPNGQLPDPGQFDLLLHVICILSPLAYHIQASERLVSLLKWGADRQTCS